MITLNRNILKIGDDGHRYCIPENMIDTFIGMVENIQNSVTFSHEWSVATDEFNEVFNSYIVALDNAK